MINNDKLIIGFGHRAQVGKDTSGVYLENEYGFEHASFAHAVKAAANIIFGLGPEHDFPPLKEEIIPRWGLSARQIYQKFGTEAMRSVFGDNIWVKALEAQIEDTGNDIVITDLRFKSEAAAIKNWGGYCIRIDRNIEGTKNSTHQSEIDLLDYTDWDYIVDNNGSFPDLFNQLDKIMADINEKEK